MSKSADGTTTSGRRQSGVWEIERWLLFAMITVMVAAMCVAEVIR
jgi:hypothetical protein